MKSEHRHDLETNELAAKLAQWIEQIKPYFGTITTGALLALAILVGVTYMQKATKARRADAWDSYHLAVEEPALDLEALKQAAEQNAGTEMAKWADLTWADGQVHRATRLYFRNRDAANDHMDKAEGVFKRTLSSGGDNSMISRAHLGLGRIAEMQNKLAEAKEHYLAVTGSFSTLAAERAEMLDEEEVSEDYVWLIDAKSPVGSSAGMPGSAPVSTLPNFEVDALGTPSDDEEEGPLLGDMLESFGRDQNEEDNRYGESDSENNSETSTNESDTTVTESTGTETAESDSSDESP